MRRVSYILAAAIVFAAAPFASAGGTPGDSAQTGLGKWLLEVRATGTGASTTIPLTRTFTSVPAQGGSPWSCSAKLRSSADTDAGSPASESVQIECIRGDEQLDVVMDCNRGGGQASMQFLLRSKATQAGESFVAICWPNGK